MPEPQQHAVSVEDQLAEAVAKIPLIDTHSHAAGFELGTPMNDRQGVSLPQILTGDYLHYLASSCAEPDMLEVLGRDWPVDDAAAHFRAVLPLLGHYRALTTYAALREGIRELHPFQEADITEKNFEPVNRQVVAAYRRRGMRSWHREACRRVGVVRQTQFCHLPYVVDHWDQLPAVERDAEAALLMPSLIIDGLLFTGFASNRPALRRTMQILGVQPTDYDGHVDLCARALDMFREHGGRSVKLLAAYARSLRFEPIGAKRARKLFDHGPDALPPDELRELQDHLFWRVVRMASERQLPLSVHTGYSSPTDWGHPEHLDLLFTAPEAETLQVDLCHAGWPHAGAAMIMARTHRRCYFNLCWLPLLSADLGRRLLGEAIDMLPMNKILIGTDCGSTESFVGTVRLIRRQLAEVLARKVREGQFDVDVAKRIARAVLFDNPAEFYGLAPRTADRPTDVDRQCETPITAS